MNIYGFLRLLWRGLYKTAVPLSGFYGLAITIVTLSGGISTITLNAFWLGISGAVILLFLCTFAAAAWTAFEVSQERSPRVCRDAAKLWRRVACRLPPEHVREKADRAETPRPLGPCYDRRYHSL